MSECMFNNNFYDGWSLLLTVPIHHARGGANDRNSTIKQTPLSPFVSICLSVLFFFTPLSLSPLSPFSPLSPLSLPSVFVEGNEAADRAWEETGMNVIFDDGLAEFLWGAIYRRKQAGEGRGNYSPSPPSLSLPFLLLAHALPLSFNMNRLSGRLHTNNGSFLWSLFNFNCP